MGQKSENREFYTRNRADGWEDSVMIPYYKTGFRRKEDDLFRDEVLDAIYDSYVVPEVHQYSDEEELRIQYLLSLEYVSRDHYEWVEIVESWSWDDQSSLN